MLGRAAERFIRTKWTDVNQLAEELFACFSPDLPIQASSIVINQSADDTSPPFTINRADGGTGPSMVINKDGGTNNFGDINITGSNFGQTNFGVNNTFGSPNVPNGNPYGDLNFQGATFTLGDFQTSPDGGSIGAGGAGGINLGNITFPGQDPATKNQVVPAPQYNPFMLYGEVQAKLSAQTYQVKCWAKSPSGASLPIGSFPVRFLMVDPSETIPAGTPCPVLCFPALSGGSSVIADAVGFVPTFFG